MLAVKTEIYKFSPHAKESQAFINYMLDKYEYGGAKIETYTKDGLIHMEVNSLIDTRDIEDFKEV